MCILELENLMRTNLRTQRNDHLELIVRMFAQPFHCMDNRPYDEISTALVDLQFSD